MFGISGEHLLVLAVILLVFGPKRLPDLGASLGRTLRNFKDAMNNAGQESEHIPTRAPVSVQIPVTAQSAVGTQQDHAQAIPAVKVEQPVEAPRV